MTIAIITRDVLKRYLGASAATIDDSLLDTFILEASMSLDMYCLRQLMATPSSDYLFDYQKSLCVSLAPLEFAAITKVYNGDLAELTIGTDCRLMPRLRSPGDAYSRIEMYPDAGKVFLPKGARVEDAIRVTGQVGVMTVADDFIKHCCTRIAAHFYRVRDTGAERSFNVGTGQYEYRDMLNKMEIDMLERYRRGPTFA